MRSEFETVENSSLATLLEGALFCAAGLGVMTLVLGACADVLRVL